MSPEHKHDDSFIANIGMVIKTYVHYHPAMHATPNP